MPIKSKVTQKLDDLSYNDDIEGYIEIQLNTLDSIKEMSDSKRMEYKKRVLSYLYNE